MVESSIHRNVDSTNRSDSDDVDAEIRITETTSLVGDERMGNRRSEHQILSNIRNHWLCTFGIPVLAQGVPYIVTYLSMFSVTTVGTAFIGQFAETLNTSSAASFLDERHNSAGGEGANPLLAAFGLAENILSLICLSTITGLVIGLDTILPQCYGKFTEQIEQLKNTVNEKRTREKETSSTTTACSSFQPGETQQSSARSCDDANLQSSTEEVTHLSSATIALQFYKLVNETQYTMALTVFRAMAVLMSWILVLLLVTELLVPILLETYVIPDRVQHTYNASDDTTQKQYSAAVCRLAIQLLRMLAVVCPPLWAASEILQCYLGSIDRPISILLGFTVGAMVVNPLCLYAFFAWAPPAATPKSSPISGTAPVYAWTTMYGAPLAQICTLLSAIVVMMLHGRYSWRSKKQKILCDVLECANKCDGDEVEKVEGYKEEEKSTIREMGLLRLFFSKAVWQPKPNWMPFLTYAIPSLGMMLCEWSSAEINYFVSSVLLTPVQFEAMVILTSISMFLFPVPLGISVAVSIVVAQHIGRQAESAVERSEVVEGIDQRGEDEVLSNGSGTGPVGVDGTSAAKRTALCGLFLLIIWFCLLAVVCLSPVRHLVPAIFAPHSPTVQALVAVGFPLLYTGHVCDCLFCLCGNVIRGVGYAKWGALISFVGYFLVGIPVSCSLMAINRDNPLPHAENITVDVSVYTTTSLYGSWLGFAAGTFVSALGASFYIFLWMPWTQPEGL